MNSSATKQGGADLHVHTTQSDGLLSPREVVEQARLAGLRAIAITDHDDVGGIEAAMNAGRELDLEVLSGVELSVAHKQFDVHLLGYLLDHRHPRLVARVQEFQNERRLRLDRILDKLAALGLRLSKENVLQRAGAGSIGRPHIADAMVEAGLTANYFEAFNLYLGDGKPAYVSKKRLSAIDAITLLHEAGGLAALAHPGQDIPDDIVLEMIEAGIDAIETVHPRHGDARRQHYTTMAHTHGLLTTGGSDFHGGRKNDERVGDWRVPYEVVEKMKNHVTTRRALWA